MSPELVYHLERSSNEHMSAFKVENQTSRTETKADSQFKGQEEGQSPKETSQKLFRSLGKKTI